MRRDKMKRLMSGTLACALALSLTACVNQHPEETSVSSNAGASSASEEVRIVATSMRPSALQLEVTQTQ